MNKKINYPTLFWGIFIGFLLAYIFHVFDIYSLISKLSNLNILGNTIDFLGNIFIAITSAVIAWWVSKSEIRKSKIVEKKRIYNEKKTYLNLLKLEIQMHIVVFENLINHTYDKKIDFIKDFESLDSNIWEKYIDKMHMDDIMLGKMYKYYINLANITKLTENEIKVNNYEMVRNLTEKSMKAISLIDIDLQKAEVKDS